MASIGCSGWVKGVLTVGIALSSMETRALAGAGELLWQEELVIGEALESRGSVAATRSAVFVSTGADTPRGDPDLVVSAYDPATGALRWRSTFDAEGRFDFNRAIAARADLVAVVGGSTDSEEETNFAELVQVLDAATGALRWRHVGSPAPGAGLLQAVAIGEGLVFAGGTQAGIGRGDWLLRAYDAETGEPRWEEGFDLARDAEFPIELVAGAGRLYAVGVGGAPRNGDWLVRCYAAATGRVLWAERLEVAGSTDLAQDAVLVGRRLIVAGDAINLATSQGTNFDLDWLVRAYDAQTGALRWQDRIMGPSDDMGLAIASSGSAAIVVGTTGDFPFDMDTRVRAYRPTSGEILWQDTIEARNALSGVAVAAEGGRVYTSASARQSDNDWRVDARDPHRGRVRWEERIDSNPGNDDPGHKAIAFGAGGRLFVLGHAPRGTLVLRAHQGG